MSPVRQGLPLVIELVGLPGAGKTSIKQAVQVEHFGRHDVGILEARLGRSAVQVFVAAFRLALSTRPLTIRRIRRSFELVVLLRCYRRHRSLPIIVDQGLTQKLWSMLAETQEFSLTLLTATVQRLAPFAPDQLVWVETPAHIAADRIAGRTGGNSRFDGRPPNEIAARLVNLLELYNLIVGLFERHANIHVLSLRGEEPITDNAARIDLLMSAK